MRRRIFGWLAIGIYLLTIFYPLCRLWYWLDWFNVFGGLVLFVVLVVPFAYATLRYMFRVRVNWLKSNVLLNWQGLCFVLFPIVIAMELLSLALNISSVLIGYFTLASWIVVGTISCFHASRLVVRKVRIDANEKTQGISIVQISDVHIGSRSTKFLSNVIAQIEKIEPDYVVITGDLVDSSDVTQTDLEPLNHLSAPTLFTIGNHERYENCDAIVGWLEAMNIHVLRNRSMDLGPFQFIGIDDAEAPNQVKSELQQIEKLQQQFTVLLYHRPLGVVDASEWGVELMLSGHTHRGQIFPFNFVVNRFFEYTHGDFDINGMLLHVSTGTGTWGPLMRLGSRNEVTHIQFA